MPDDHYPTPESIVRRIVDDCGAEAARERVRTLRREIDLAMGMAAVLVPALRDAGRDDIANLLEANPLGIDLDAARALVRAAVEGAGPGVLDGLMRRRGGTNATA